MKRVPLVRFVCFLLVVLTVAFCVSCQKNPAANQSSGEPVSSSEPSEMSSGETEETSGEPVEYLPLTDYLSQMAKTPYRISGVPEEKVGLTSPDQVGIDREAFENEEKYPVPPDDQFEHIYRVETFGITPENMTDNATQFNKLMVYLKTISGLKKVVFSPGVYYIERTLTIEGVEDLYICCSDPTQNFEWRLTGWFQAVNCNNCKNIHFNNYDLDYEYPTTVAGELVKASATGEVVVKIYDEFDLSAPVYNGGAFRHNHSYIEFGFSDELGVYVPVNNALYNGNVQFVSYDDETKELTLRLGNATMSKCVLGSPVSVAYSMYEYFGFHGINNDGIYFENVHIYTCGGMAFGHQTSTVYMNRMSLDLREGSKRLMTATADGFHCTDCPAVTLTNCTFQYSHDDCMNVKSWYKDVVLSAGKTLQVSSTSANFAMNVGDELEIFDPKDFRLVDTLVITEVVESTKTTYTLLVDKSMDENYAGYLMANTTRGTRLTVSNCLFGNKRNRGILVQCRESIITGNTFWNIMHGVLCIYTIRDSCCEGICPKGIRVCYNKFINNSGIHTYNYGYSGTGTPGVLRNIDIYENFFTNYNSPVGMNYTGDSSVYNNLFYNVGVGATSPDTANAIMASNSLNVKIYGNYAFSDEYQSRFKTVYISSGNRGAEVSDNHYKALDNGKTKTQ